MDETKIVNDFLHYQEKLNELGFEILTNVNNFLIVKKGKSYASVLSVDGIRGFYYGIDRASK